MSDKTRCKCGTLFTCNEDHCDEFNYFCPDCWEHHVITVQTYRISTLNSENAELLRKLEVARKALKEYARHVLSSEPRWAVAEEALKEIGDV